MSSMIDLRQAFLEDVLANPGDDVVRLIFADWLEDNGDEARAKFVRAQIALANMPSGVACVKHLVSYQSCPQCCVQRRRERSLLLAHGHDWTMALGVGIKTITHDRGPDKGVTVAIVTGCEKGSDVATEYRRGFVEKIALSAENWMEHADALVAATPIMQVRLVTWPTVSQLRDEYLKMDWMEGADAVTRHVTESGARVTQLLCDRCFHDVWPKIKFTLPN